MVSAGEEETLSSSVISVADWPVDMELSANIIDEVDINIGADENIIPPEDEGEIFLVNELIFSLVILSVEDGVNIAVLSADVWPVDMELSATIDDEVEINIGVDENVILPEGEIVVFNELILSLVILFFEDEINITVDVTLCVEEGTTLKVDVMIFSMLMPIQKYSKMWMWKERREIN